jgi:predicted ribosomally synthesized peptide with nif11-like leader
MAKNAEKFIEKMSKDNKFRKKVADLYRANAHKEIEELAAKAGFACSFNELLKTFKTHGVQGKKLSDKELELYAGKNK